MAQYRARSTLPSGGMALEPPHEVGCDEGDEDYGTADGAEDDGEVGWGVFG